MSCLILDCVIESEGGREEQWPQSQEASRTTWLELPEILPRVQPEDVHAV